MEDKAALVESKVGEDQRRFDREFILGVIQCWIYSHFRCFWFLQLSFSRITSNRQKKAGNPGLLLSAFFGQRGVIIAGSQCI